MWVEAPAYLEHFRWSSSFGEWVGDYLPFVSATTLLRRGVGEDSASIRHFGALPNFIDSPVWHNHFDEPWSEPVRRDIQ